MDKQLDLTNLEDCLEEEHRLNNQWNFLADLYDYAENEYKRGPKSTTNIIKHFLDEYFNNVYIKHCERNEQEMIKSLKHNLDAYLADDESEE